MGYLMANREIIEYLQRDSTGFCCSRMGLHAAEAPWTTWSSRR